MNIETELKFRNDITPEGGKILTNLVKQFKGYLVDVDYGLDGKLVDDAPESARKAQKEWMSLVYGDDDDGFKRFW